MRHLLIFSVIAITSISLLSACGPSEEELQRQEQARQDSLEQVRQRQLQQQRMDSIAQARQDSINTAEQQKQRRQMSFNTTGAFSLQVEAWRSQEKAQAQVDKWKERGFENAYVVKYGQEETGNIWFRVRLGKTDSKEQAEQLGSNLNEEYGSDYWIGNSD